MPDVTTSSDVDAFMIAANAAAMRTAIGLGSVDNVADASKPVSSATQAALDLKANLTSAVLVTPSLGTPTSGVLTNCTGTAAGLTAGSVTTNANLTGHVTSVGNAAVLGTFTKAQLDAAVSDGNVLYVGDAPTSHNHSATEITSGTLPVARLAFTKAELSTAVSDGDVLFVGDVSGSAVTVRDIDGTPSIAATTIEFTNGTVSDQGSGVARVTISGSGDALVSGTLDQFADVTQTGGATLAISASTTLNGGTHSGTNTGDQTNITGNAATVTTNANLTGPVTSVGNATAIANGAISNAMLANSAVANLSGTNSGDQTITLTGMVTGSGTGSFVASLGSFTKAQLNTAISDGDALFEPLVMPATAMGALAIDVAKYVNTKSISADSTMTFSNNTPTAGTRTEVRITTDATARTVTLPSCYSFARNASITTVLIPASSTASLSLEYTGARWEIYGDPVETTGTGSYVLATSPTLVTPILGTPTSGTLTNATGLPIVAGTTGTLSVARGGTGTGTIGTAGQILQVNAGATALEFVTATGGGNAQTANPLSQFAATTSAQLAGVISDETGSGALVFATSPTLVTPSLGNGSYTALRTTEVSNVISANAATITLGNGNHQTLTLAAATAAVTVDFVMPASASAGTLILLQDDTARDITWTATGGGTILWAGTQPTWDADTASSYRLIAWRYDGTRLFLSPTESFTANA